MIHNATMPHIQSVDFCHLILSQRKVPDIEILLHAIFMHSLGDNYCAPVRLSDFLSFVTDAFDPERPVENKVVIPIEDENFQTPYYFLCLDKDWEKYLFDNAVDMILFACYTNFNKRICDLPVFRSCN